MTKRCTAWHIGGRKRFIECRVCGKARQRDDASIVPYKSFAAFIIIGKVSLRRDEGIPPYGDNIPFGVYTKKSRAFDSSAFAFYGDFLFYALLLFFSTHSPHTTVMNMVMSISGRVLPSTKSMFIKMR